MKPAKIVFGTLWGLSGWWFLSPIIKIWDRCGQMMGPAFSLALAGYQLVVCILACYFVYRCAAKKETIALVPAVCILIALFSFLSRIVL